MKNFSKSLPAISIVIVTVVVTAKLFGIFQLLELNILDKFFQWRPAEGVDARIVMVTFDESDINRIGKWPFSDAVVSSLISTVQSGKPKVIGLDLYRNLPVEPGSEELKSVFQSIPSLIVAEKYVNPSVSPPPYLNYEERVGFVDVTVDPDGAVRRALLSIQKSNGSVIYGFGIKIALKYLETENILPQINSDSDRTVIIGKSTIVPLNSHDAGYANADVGGYQTLMNYRCRVECFPQVSMSDVLDGNYDKDLFKDRIVLIGAIAESLRDFFFSPYGKIPGVYIHANLISQIVSGAIDGRKSLQTYSKLLEGILVLIWSLISVKGISAFLKAVGLGKIKFIAGILTFLIVAILGLLGISYFAFLCGLWLPILPALCSFSMSSIVCIIYLGEQFRYASNIDELTQIANRRYFDRFLLKNFITKKDLSVILCDIDHFKLYNDTYGHQAGDICLKRVADSISKSVRNGELAGRYGGEEFAVVLPNTNFQTALSVAERIVANVRKLNIPHKSSQTSNVVTLSCGVADMTSEDGSSLDLLIKADRALYRAKEAGRDRVVG